MREHKAGHSQPSQAKPSHPHCEFSVTRWANYFSIFGRLQQCNFDQLQFLAKEGLKYCQILVKTFRKIVKDGYNFWPKWQNVAKFGHTALDAPKREIPAASEV